MGGCTPIPFTAIDAWARRHGLDDEAFDLLLSTIRALDAVFCAHAREQAEKSAKAHRDQQQRR